MFNRLNERAFWEIKSVKTGRVVSSGTVITRKAAVALGTKFFGFTGIELRAVPQKREV